MREPNGGEFIRTGKDRADGVGLNADAPIGVLSAVTVEIEPERALQRLRLRYACLRVDAAARQLHDRLQSDSHCSAWELERIQQLLDEAVEEVLRLEKEGNPAAYSPHRAHLF